MTPSRPRHRTRPRARATPAAIRPFYDPEPPPARAPYNNEDATTRVRPPPTAPPSLPAHAPAGRPLRHPPLYDNLIARPNAGNPALNRPCPPQ